MWPNRVRMRRDERNNLGINFSYYVCCDRSLEPSRRDGSNEGSQHMFSLRNKKISLNYSQYSLISGTLI